MNFVVHFKVEISNFCDKINALEGSFEIANATIFLFGKVHISMFKRVFPLYQKGVVNKVLQGFTF